MNEHNRYGACSILDAIGQTPLVELKRICADIDGRIVAKLEYLNPGFSKKDRAALRIIEEAERSGELQPGQTVIELTSGNMGTGLAIVCAAKGYPFVAVMSKGNSPERARMMRAFGAEVVLVDQAPGATVGEVSGDDLQLVDEKTTKLTQERVAFRADQFGHPGNRRAHYYTTAPEIWQQSGASITAFCDFAGSGGTFAGCAQYFKEQDPGVTCYLVEPQGAAALSGESVTEPQHPIQGGGYAMQQLPQLQGVKADGYLEVSPGEAIECTRRLAREEGIFAGYSSGANLAGALKLLSGPLAGATVAILACDSGLKYLSTNLWD
ncbi:MAG: cysteine synthase family protein [Woeseiaceae bacterium]|nr:cysteine synthase family protein [Woeseiaceae bacterium]